ncbi:MAG: cytochrome P450 [Nocardioidaceae bacterium]
MSGRPLAALDLSDSAFLEDPYPTLAAARKAGPVGWHEPTGMWLVTRHRGCSAVLRERRFGRIWRDKEPAARLEPFNLLHRNQMMENEPPHHTRLRRKVAAAFARGHVERMRPRVRAIGAALLGEVRDQPFDALADFAEPLPVLVISELLGAPATDVSHLRSWSQAIVKMYEPSVPSHVEDDAIQAADAFAAYMRLLVDERRSSPKADLLSDLVRAQSGEDGLTDDEVLASAILLLNAGHEASVNVFGNGLVALLGHRDQWRRLATDGVPAATAVEEMLRFDSALQLFERTATADVEVEGWLVRRGERVAVLLGSANRDEAVFPAADSLDVMREPNPHLAFGAGLHFCLGAPLARMELEESLRLLVDACPRLVLSHEPNRRSTFVLRGYESVPVAST